MSKLFTNAKIFTSIEGDDSLYESMVVDAGQVVFVGDMAEALSMAHEAKIVDLQGKVVLPGIIDAHTHLIMLGESMVKMNLLSKSLEEIQGVIQSALSSKPRPVRLLGKGLLFDALGVAPHKRYLDQVAGDVPVFIDSADLHSSWLSSAALEAIGVDKDTLAPQGGTFVKDEQGELTGLLLETAVTTYVWPYLSQQLTLDNRIADIDRVFRTYLSCGVTGAVEMAMTEPDLAALEAVYHRDGSLPIRISAHWIVFPAPTEGERLDQVWEAARHRERLEPLSRWLRVVGIKIISDGVVDSCTAYLSKPYADGSLPGPIWPSDQLNPVVALADSLDLQIAVHAIGDAASCQALDAIEAAVQSNGYRPARRHRLEHLEVVSTDSIARLTQMGVTASLQPVHADPVYVPNWRKMLGEDERCDRAFPWSEYVESQSNVAFGTDAPTAPHHCLPNVYTAVTRRSTINPKLPEPTDPRIIALDKLTINLQTAIRFHTAGGALSLRDENVYGSLSPGMAADFCVLDVDPFKDGVDTLREAQESVYQTWVNGELAWERK